MNAIKRLQLTRHYLSIEGIQLRNYIITPNKIDPFDMWH
ncbi:hypothetical protein YPPY61_0069 [Yersinia pestis PY-61]|nr:hypothetical protein YPPY61_2321 [Yersinia pestis PY-61]EIS62834.1 hypothetical protein YPPY61_0069 [Yersinia pestis PY-61]